MAEYIELETAIKEMSHMMRECFPEADEELDAVITTLKEIPAADVVEVVRCRECCYAPSGTDKWEERGLGLEWPERMTNKCPLMCVDSWYSHKPEPDFFCAFGKRKNGGQDE